MRVHHTKTTGDLGVLQAQLDLVNKGYWILLPQTEHAPFDLVAYREGMFLRVQVKYRAAVNGVITVPFTTCWADRHGTHVKYVDRESIDVFCVYCPDTNTCFYIDPRAHPTARLHLRIVATRNNVSKGVHWAHRFTDIPASVLARCSSLVAAGNVRQSP